MVNISYYGSHNSAFAVEVDGTIELVLEAERFFNYKNTGITQYKTVNPIAIPELTNIILDYIKTEIGVTEFDNCYYLNTDVIVDEETINTHKLVPAKRYETTLHHRSHAAGCFYQSNYQEALIFSFDGGGNDGFFNIYHATRQDSVRELEKVINPHHNTPHIYYDLGFPYMIFGHYLEDIRIEPISDGNLVYSGKIMGLASYGEVNLEYLPHIIDFYKRGPNGLNYEDLLKDLGTKIGVDFDISNRLHGKIAYDIAATSQRAFEECFLEVITPYLNQYPDLPVGIAGGCGLNIILNTRLKTELNREVFVGPNPNDCGIAVGMLLDKIKPPKAIDVTYSGTKLLDYNMLGTYIQNSNTRLAVEYKKTESLIQHLSEGKIVGVARGKAEHGPRALGNRSILCNPALPDMKDTLNNKVKNREWYRPFAPVVRLEDVSEYFEWEGESRWMSFCPKVKAEWKDKLPSITHVDGTARVQTVTEEQNKWLYDLLTEFKQHTGNGVLLNTSFNVAGKPILSSLHDAFSLFESSQMDALVINEHYIYK